MLFSMLPCLEKEKGSETVTDASKVLLIPSDRFFQLSLYLSAGFCLRMSSFLVLESLA